jgi:hypothetical protein
LEDLQHDLIHGDVWPCFCRCMLWMVP